jgi:hypothetical protein
VVLATGGSCANFVIGVTQGEKLRACGGGRSPDHRRVPGVLHLTDPQPAKVREQHEQQLLALPETSRTRPAAVTVTAPADGMAD